MIIQRYFLFYLTFIDNAMKIQIDVLSKKPVYKQIIDQITDKINSGELNDGDQMPSMNVLASDLQISKETIKKAYNILRHKGMIDSKQGKGYYVLKNKDPHIKILLLFDKISTYKQVLYSSFASNIGDDVEITIRLHNQDIDLFEQFIDENIDHFDYYIITPHFPLEKDVQKRVKKLLRKIPNRKLIVLDRYIETITGNYGLVYQDAEQDVIIGLNQGLDDIKRYNKLKILSMPGSLYASLLSKGIVKFCSENRIDHKFFYNTSHPDLIQKGDLFLILNSQLDVELIEIARVAKTREFKIGKDIGIISYNDSPINEIVLNGLTVLSTDFEQMGRLAAQMIREKELKKIKCNFRLIRRSTF